MTVTIDRIGKVVSAVEAWDAANFRVRRMADSISDAEREEIESTARARLDNVIALEVALHECVEVEASYNHALDTFHKHQSDSVIEQRYREASVAVRRFRQAHRIFEEAAGRRTPGVSVHNSAPPSVGFEE
jgi:hypothetical protein